LQLILGVTWVKFGKT